jgi:hypothetical protein
MKQSDQVRELAKARYIRPALEAGKTRFSVAVRDVLRDLVIEGFPPNNTPQVCSALRKKSFLLDQGIEIESIDGPPKKMSPTVVYHYRVRNHAANDLSERLESSGLSPEEAGERARKLGESLRGLLKEEIAAYGGTEEFIRWVRGYDEEDAA